MMETGSRFIISESMFRIVRKIMNTVFQRIIVATTILFWRLKVRATSIQGRKLLFSWFLEVSMGIQNNNN